MITEQTLKRFCGEAGRYSLDEPFTCDGHRYATDGRICIRILHAAADSVHPKGEHYPNAPMIFKPFDAAKCVKPWIQVVPEHRECKECGGSGETTCDKCGHSDECLTCDCAGIIYDDLPLEETFIRASNVILINSLSNVRYGLIRDNLMQFVFDGGEGLCTLKNHKD